VCQCVCVCVCVCLASPACVREEKRRDEIGGEFAHPLHWNITGAVTSSPAGSPPSAAAATLIVLHHNPPTHQSAALKLSALARNGTLCLRFTRPLHDGR
jgi:hypothetical protein